MHTQKMVPMAGQDREVNFLHKSMGRKISQEEKEGENLLES